MHGQVNRQRQPTITTWGDTAEALRLVEPGRRLARPVPGAARAHQARVGCGLRDVTPMRVIVPGGLQQLNVQGTVTLLGGRSPRAHCHRYLQDRHPDASRGPC